MALLAVLALCSQAARAEEVWKSSKANSDGAICLDGAPAYVSALARQIEEVDMNRWRLSEDKGVRWLITKVAVVDDDLVLVDLTDGNGEESVLFDRGREKGWSIVSRTSLLPP